MDFGQRESLQCVVISTLEPIIPKTTPPTQPVPSSSISQIKMEEMKSQRSDGLPDRLVSMIDAAASDRNLLTTLRSKGDEIAGIDESELILLLEHLVARMPNQNANSIAAVEIVFHHLNRRDQNFAGNIAQITELLCQFYASLPANSNVRNQILGMLAAVSDPVSLGAFVDLLVNDPPTNQLGIVLALAPLLDANRAIKANDLFPKILDAIEHQHLAAAVLDIANFFYRNHDMSEHPAIKRKAMFLSLLDKLTNEMSLIESGAGLKKKSAQQISGMVRESVSLIVSLCDTLGLFGDRDAIKTIKKAMNLKHRRVQTEAAAALARLGDDEGKHRLLNLVEEPTARLRVNAYADELGLSDQLSDEFRSPVALAESQLAIWLAEPTQMGIAPTEIQLLDQRELYWPGFEELQTCFLFRYGYQGADQSYSNIGIAGPICHATEADLTHLNFDDVYALFAGWQTTHDEIYEIAFEHLTREQKQQFEEHYAPLNSLGYESISPQFVGRFFGHELFVASATKINLNTESQMAPENLDDASSFTDDSLVTGTVVFDSDRVAWVENSSDGAPIPPQLAYCLVRGRELLQQFNH